MEAKVNGKMNKLFKRKEKSVTKEKSKKDKEENEISIITKKVVKFCKPSKNKRKNEKNEEEEIMTPEVSPPKVETKEKPSQVQEMHHIINKLKDFLDQDRQNLLGPANNLKYIHNQLSQLEKSRDNNMRQAYINQSFEINTLQDYYKPLEEFSKDFDSYLWESTRKIITFDWQAKTAIVQLVEIIEEKDAVAYESDLTSNTLNERKIKSYKEKFSETLKDSIIAKFGNILNKERSHLAIIDKLEFVYEDLKSINNQIAPQFPNISRELVLTYHKNVYSLLDDILQSKPDVEIIFRLIRWVRQYHIIVLIDLQDLQMSKDLLKPQLLDGREQELVDEYINIMCSKIQEWKPNLIKNNIEEFIKRAQNPDIIDENQLFRLTETSITINMINQTVEIAINSAHNKILVETIKECCQVMIDLQQDMNRTLESESLKFIEKIPPDNFIEYAFALANDQLRYADFIEEIIKRTQTTSKECIYEIKEKTSLILDGCFRLANIAIDTIMKIIYNEINEFLELHTSSWYKEPGKFMKDIIAKLRSDTEHYRPHLKLYLFDKFIRTMTQFFVIAYIESMIKNNTKYKMPQCLELMKQDIQEAHEYFGIYLKATEIEQQFDPILKLQEFLTTNGKWIDKDYNSIKNAYGDIPRKLLKKFLSKRNDLNKFQLKMLGKTIKTKELEMGEYTGEPTIFSKVTIKQEDEDINALQQFKEVKDGIKNKFRQDSHQQCKNHIQQLY
ncbi:494_t:CDS:2 [Diversispora eburnea]|uniref:494_t:CDS:1 n=1 Tax=Diversispora eburnea TaxID=1213867 RepID=A0A9N8UZC8_9GLOM|nr:494_t:CDS:2 [Diversispora eburnea]